MNKAFLADMRDLLEQGYGGMFLVERYTRKVDELISGIFDSIDKNARIAFIATGGYGRGELAPFSDIDIMFFAPDRINTETAEILLYRLWDTGLAISHSFRTAEECIEESRRDIRTRTSLLEARYVAGDRRLFELFRKKVYPEIAHKNQKAYVRTKLGEINKRHKDSGESVFTLQPDIKEGKGGLRDVHAAYWIAKVSLKINSLSDFSAIMGAYDYRRFLGAYDFLLKTRCCLHLEAGRKNDILTFEYQRGVAHALGFSDSLKFRAAERFMRYYHLKSNAIRELSHTIIAESSRQYVTVRKELKTEKINDDFYVSAGQLVLARDDLFRENPDRIMESFYLYSKTGRKLSSHLRDAVRANLLRITKRTMQSRISIKYFLGILKSRRVYDTLREMHDTGVLGRFIPEFGALRLLVIHEPFHRYTVDEHTLIAIRNLEDIRTTRFTGLEHLKNIIDQLGHFDSLVLALLLHDIGKAFGRHHEEEGYKRLKAVMERFNLDSRERMKIEFLVKNHILMSKIALKRETDDIEVIARFSDSVGDRENLKALYLITYADMSAVNPGFLSSWKRHLLNDLYERTLNYFSGVKDNLIDYIAGVQRLAPEIESRDIIGFVNGMPERYIVSVTAKKLLEDYLLVGEMKRNSLAVRFDNQSEGIVEIVISAFDRPGLFSKVVGFMSFKGLNIVNGRIYTGQKGIVIDKIAVSNWSQIWWQGLEDDLKEGFKSIIINDAPVPAVRHSRQSAGIFDIFIELDNDASDEYSIVEIFSPDRVGLLYDISNIMYMRGINIVNARINTETGLAQDIFYIQTDGGKVNDIRAQELLSALWTMLRE